MRYRIQSPKFHYLILANLASFGTNSWRLHHRPPLLINCRYVYPLWFILLVEMHVIATIVVLFKLVDVIYNSDDKQGLMGLYICIIII